MAAAPRVLERLKTAAQSLYSTSLSFPGQAECVSHETSLSATQLELIHTLQYEAWLKSQLDSLADAERRAQARIERAQAGPVADSEQSIADKKASIAELRRELYEASVVRTREDMLLARLAEHGVLERAVLGADDSGGEDDDDGGAGAAGRPGSVIKALAHRRDQKVAELLLLTDEISAVQGALRDAERSCLQAQDRTRALRVELSQLVRARSAALDVQRGRPLAPEAQRERIAVDQQNQQAVIMRNVLQALVIESTVNWAQDETICQFMLDLDSPPEIVEARLAGGSGQQ